MSARRCEGGVIQVVASGDDFAATLLDVVHEALDLIEERDGFVACITTNVGEPMDDEHDFYEVTAYVEGMIPR